MHANKNLQEEIDYWYKETGSLTSEQIVRRAHSLGIQDSKSEICDKLGNPIDALDSYISILKTQNIPEAEEMDILIEKIKTIFHKFRQS